MKLHHLSLAVLVALAAPAAVRADTVYYGEPGQNGIQSVSGTILEETDGAVKIATADGRTVSIPRDDVYKIIRDTKSMARLPETSAESRAMKEALSDGAYSAPAGASSSGRTYNFGFKGGLNMANMSVDPQDLEEGDSLTGYALGAWVGLPVNRRFAVQAEALYSLKGDSESAGGYTSSTRMAYIDVPVVARVGFLHGSKAQPSVFLGPSLAINVSATSRLEGEDVDIEVDVKDQVNTFDLGLVLGGGVDFAVGRRTVGVELRYSKGLSNIAGEGANGTARNDVLAVLGSVGL